MKKRIHRTGESLLPRRVRERRRAERRAASEAAKAAEAERKRLQRIAEGRAALLSSTPELRRFQADGEERIGRIAARFTAAGASARNLRLVADVLEAAGIDYFLVPGRSPTRHVVGVRTADRGHVWTAMREHYRGTALYVGKPAPGGTVRQACLYADGALPKEVKSARAVRFGEFLLGPAGQVLGGLEFGCDVEFWQDGAAFLSRPDAEERHGRLRTQQPAEVVAESLIAPRRNQVSDVLPAEECKPATRQIQGREYPTFVPFALPRVEDVDFPIDAVYTWVDGSDPRLAAKREAHRGENAPAPDGRLGGDSRYTDHEELRYSLRSLEMYADFVRNVYIVTDGQVPDWLDTGAPGVTVVDHREIFPDPAVLPVFNSHAIGTRLHRIPGLSERYLYFNDDVFLGRPIRPQHFFHGNGLARVPFSSYQFGLGTPHSGEPAPNSSGKNVRELLWESHGRFIAHKFKHVPHPQLKSVMRELEERFPEEIEQTSRSRFRAPTDIAMGATLHHHYALLNGRAVPGDFRLRYVDIGADHLEERLGELEAERGYEFFCLNDVNTPDEKRERVASRVREFLTGYFPYPSRFERAPG